MTKDKFDIQHLGGYIRTIFRRNDILGVADIEINVHNTINNHIDTVVLTPAEFKKIVAFMNIKLNETDNSI